MDTNLRSQAPVTNEKPAQMLYCVKHEQMVKAETSVCGLGHVVADNGELEFCCFEAGYTFCPPPAELADLPEDWASQPDCLSDDERAAAEVNEMGMWKEGME